MQSGEAANFLGFPDNTQSEPHQSLKRGYRLTYHQKGLHKSLYYSDMICSAAPQKSATLPNHPTISHHLPASDLPSCPLSRVLKTSPSSTIVWLCRRHNPKWPSKENKPAAEAGHPKARTVVIIVLLLKPPSHCKIFLMPLCAWSTAPNQRENLRREALCLKWPNDVCWITQTLGYHDRNSTRF